VKLDKEEKEALVIYRKQKAADTLNEAEGIASLGYWNAVVNRLYYACYYMVTALLAHNNFFARTHSGVIRLFGLNFVSKGLIPKDQAKFYSKLFELRQTGDYDDLYNLTEKEVKPLIEPARQFIKAIEKIKKNRHELRIRFSHLNLYQSPPIWGQG
jgi:uncharacterized protein (UPF0332 family)